MMLTYALIPVALAILCRKNTVGLMLAFVFCAVVYAFIYARLIHFSWVLPKLRLTKRPPKDTSNIDG